MVFYISTLNFQLFFIHLNRKTSRILSVNRIPKRCVLDLNSIRFKSFVVGLAGDLPNTVNKPAASKLRNEFILVRTRILVKYHHYLLNSSCCGNSICHSREKPTLSEAEWAGIQFFALDPCSPLLRGQVYPCGSSGRGDIVDFRFPQQ